MKKLKNPMKYIERLKRYLSWEKENNDYLRKELHKAVGSFWFTYKAGTEKGVVLGLNATRRCRINDKVIIHGNVRSIVPNDGGDYAVTFHIHDVHIKEAP